jgi:aspartyl-tRNA synthetase
MVAGVERYFQIARCFRDEDQRGDRQPEFTQLDLEMSFVERDDIIGLTEELFTQLIAEVVPQMRLLQAPWPRFSYNEVMERFGKDNPDIRFGMELQDISDIAEECGFQIFENVVARGGNVRGINAKGLGNYSRKQIDELTEFISQFGAKGLAYIALTPDGDLRSNFAKYLSDEHQKEIVERLEGQPGDLVLFVADQPSVVFESLGRLREMLGERLGLFDPNTLALCWVVDFPLVVWNEEENRWDPSHHMFTAPMPEDVNMIENNPGDVRSQQYDMVLNGVEVGGGSIRIHESELQAKIFELIGLDPEVARQRFGHMLEAFQYGTPPHGGIAPGIDRICMILAGEPNIREVIAFPKNQNARDVMGNAPSPVDSDQLRELHIKLDV